MKFFTILRDARRIEGFFNYYNIIFKKNQGWKRQTTSGKEPIEDDG